MLDIHCHILPNVDDGPASLAEALAVAQLCVTDGITHITATPHCHRFLRLFRADILPHVARFNQELGRAGVPLTVLPGSEIQVLDVEVYRREEEQGIYCHLGGGRAFTLLECPWQDTLYPVGVPELARWLRERGTIPIVAHPERHNYFRDDPARLRALVEAGAWLQITVDSLLGNHGPAPLRAANELLGTYAEAVLATDTHNLQRCSGLSKGYALVTERFGAERSADLRTRAEGILQRLLAEVNSA